MYINSSVHLIKIISHNSFFTLYTTYLHMHSSNSFTDKSSFLFHIWDLLPQNERYVATILFANYNQICFMQKKCFYESAISYVKLLPYLGPKQGI